MEKLEAKLAFAMPASYYEGTMSGAELLSKTASTKDVFCTAMNKNVKESSPPIPRTNINPILFVLIDPIP